MLRTDTHPHAPAAPGSQARGPGTASEASTRLLVVGDDPRIITLICATLRIVGHQVRTARNADDALTLTEHWRPHLTLQDGFELTRHLRGQRHSVPAIFLSPGDHATDHMPGLTIGGGDYLTKPFSPEELRARVRAVIRRTNFSQLGPGNAVYDIRLQFADLELHEETREVNRDGRPIQLSPTEFSLLRYLMHNSGQTLSRTQILDHVWPYDYTGGDQVVDTYICKLRRKVNKTSPPLIHTIRGIGYGLHLSHS